MKHGQHKSKTYNRFTKTKEEKEKHNAKGNHQTPKRKKEKKGTRRNIKSWKNII